MSSFGNGNLTTRFPSASPVVWTSAPFLNYDYVTIYFLIDDELSLEVRFAS